MYQQELVAAQRAVVRPGRPTHARRMPEAGVLGLQQLAGNAAVSQLIRSQRRQPVVAHPVQRTVVQRCGGGGKCACQSQARDRDQPDVTVQRKNYGATHTCGLKESARIFTSWSVAVAKLVENLPALDFALTGVHTPHLKRKLLQHFNATNKAERKRVLRKIVPRYHQILLRMGPGLAKVRCGGTHCQDHWYAYTFGGTGNSRLWLCKVEFANNPILDLASTWIHELSHAFYGTVDLGYYQYTGATTRDLNGSLNEADCYGNFMVDYT